MLALFFSVGIILYLTLWVVQYPGSGYSDMSTFFILILKLMRCFGLTILLTFIVSAGISQTYYYERIAVVQNGVKTAASGDGHFITFTSKGCYDSDVKGFTEDFGFREYKTTSSGIQNFYGDSYFGKAYYYFNSDRSRMNIKKESDGTIYIYTKRTAPAGITKSTRKKASDAGYSGPMSPIVIPSDGGTVTSLPTSTCAPATPQTRRCSGCSGTGLCSMCKGKGWYKNSYDSKIYSCPSCHGSGRCGVCYGKGFINN